MDAPITCPKCGAPLLEGALGGLCRKCLGRLGFGLANDHPAPEAGAEPGVCRFGDYELLEEIARGGMGVVYKARQVSLNRLVAVKMILHGPFSSPEFVQRFHTEAQAAAALHHPNIVAIYEVGQLDGQHYFSMEYIQGKGLAEVARDKPLPARRAAAYVKTMAEAMHYAHEHGVLHRDLKPSNVLLDQFDQPRITDFGLAKLLNGGSELTLTGQALGSPNHMPPEQAGGHRAAGPEGDIYSLGAILYHLTTGRPPFQGETLQSILMQVQEAEPIPPRRLNPSVPLELQTICLKCLQKEPGDRYRSAQALAQDLGRFLANEPIQARPVPPARRAWLWCRRHPAAAVLSAALVVAVACGLGGVLREWGQAERHALGEARQRHLAEDYATKTRLNLYAADISLASQAIQRGDYGLARRTLAALAPEPGQAELRGFEWRYLWKRCRGEQLATFVGHTWIVNCAAFSPDGRFVASGSQDGTAKVWDVEQRRLLITLNGCICVWSAAFSPDGRRLVTGSVRDITVWSTNNWRPLTNFPGHLASISRVGTLLAVADSSPFFWEPAGPVRIWDYDTGEKLAELTMPGRVVALSREGRLLAVAGENNGIRIYRLTETRSVPRADGSEADPDERVARRLSCELVRTLPTRESVWSLAFSPDSTRLISTGWSADALVWDLAAAGSTPRAGQIPAANSSRQDSAPPGRTPFAADAPSPAKLSGHHLTVWSGNFSPDGASIVTSGSDQTIRLWDAASLRLKGVLKGHNSEVWCASFSPDSKLLATGSKDQTVRLWSANLSENQDTIPNPGGGRPLFSPDSQRLLLVNLAAPDFQVRVWDVQRRQLVQQCVAGSAAGFSPDGTRILRAADRGPRLEIGLAGDTNATLIPLESLLPNTVSFAATGFSPEYRYFFALDQSGRVKCWEAGSGKLRATFVGPVPPIRAAKLGPGGCYLAVSLERENCAHLFETGTGKEMKLADHKDFVSGLAFSPDGTVLATGSMDGTIRLWDTGNGRLVARLPGHMEEVTEVAFSPDGATLASLGHKESIKLWHLATQRELVSLDFPEAGTYLAFSPDGRHLAVSTEDNGLRLLEAPLAQEIGIQ